MTEFNYGTPIGHIFLFPRSGDVIHPLLRLEGLGPSLLYNFIHMPDMIMCYDKCNCNVLTSDFRIVIGAGVIF